MYFNYHAKIKHLIEKGHLVDYKFLDQWNQVSPALVLFFDNARPMPIRQHKWKEYESLMLNLGIFFPIPDDLK